MSETSKKQNFLQGAALLAIAYTYDWARIFQARLL